MQIYDLSIDEHRRETTVHGSFEFPVAVYENRISRNTLKLINWHWHEELQFCYVTRGKVLFFLNGRVCMVKKGEGIFINSEVIHMAKEGEQSEGTYICIDFHPRIISSFPGSIFDRKYTAPILKGGGMESLQIKGDALWEKNILERLKSIRRAFEEKAEGYELEVCGDLYMIWKNMAVRFQSSSVSDRGRTTAETANRRIREIITFIRQNYQNKITLSQISEQLHVSPNECCRFFKKNMRCTIFEYIAEYRITKSMELLKNTDMSVAQIAYETGFGSSSYYIEKFRRKTGMTPLLYRTGERT